MTGIKTSLDNIGYLTIDSFVEIRIAEKIMKELIIGFKSPEVIHVDMDDIKLKTLNGSLLLDMIPLVGELYNNVRISLSESFPSLVELNDKKIGISANLIEGGGCDNFRMHFDRNQLTIVIYLNTLNCLPLTIFPNIRMDIKNTTHKPDFSISDKSAVDIYPVQGRTIIFYGNRTWHGVVNKDGSDSNTKRYTLQFAFDFDHFDYDNENYYGKITK